MAAIAPRGRRVPSRLAADMAEIASTSATTAIDERDRDHVHGALEVADQLHREQAEHGQRQRGPGALL